MASLAACGTHGDPDGDRTGLVQKWKEAAVTLGDAPPTMVGLRREGRDDESDSSVLVRRTLIDPQTGRSLDAADDQASIAIETRDRF